MTREPWRTIMIGLMSLAAFACGVIGLIAGLVDREWKLTPTGWFTGGTLLAALILIVLAEAYFQARREATRGQD